jgi:hypothetical protein
MAFSASVSTSYFYTGLFLARRHGPLFHMLSTPRIVGKESRQFVPSRYKFILIITDFWEQFHHAAKQQSQYSLGF